MTVRRPALISCALCLVLGCSRPANAPSVEVTLESGPMAAAGVSAGRVDRSSPDLASVGYVTGYSAEPSGGGTGAWHSDLRLTNGTRLLVASSAAPEVRLPAGFALPLGQILADMPDAWRGVRLVSSAGEGVEKVRWRIDTLPKGATGLKRLYVLELAATSAAAAQAATPSWSGMSPVAGSEWTLAPGQQSFSQRIANVPVDATVHAATAYGGPWLTSLRLRDGTEGKTLWEAARAAGSGRIEPYQSENGFVLSHDHAYEIDAEYDVPESAAGLGSAVVFLYYQLPENETVSYPFPPAED